MEDPVTTNLAKFGFRELKLAAELLNAYVGDPNAVNLWDGVTIAMNDNSGHVFLTDEDFNIAMMNGDKLEQWYSCPECGEEGFREDIEGEDHWFDDGTLEHGEKPKD